MNDQWDMSGIEVTDDNFLPPVDNPQEDRITAILQKRAQPIQFAPDQMQNAGQAAVHYALGGRTRGISDILDSIRNPIIAQQDREYDSAKGLYDLFEEKRARGDRQAQSVADAMGKITSNPDDQGKLLEWLHGLPEKVDPNNPNKLLMLLARGKRELGIQTDFERTQAEDELNRRYKEAQIKNLSAGGGTNVSAFERVLSSAGLSPEKVAELNAEWLETQARGGMDPISRNLLMPDPGTGVIMPQPGVVESKQEIASGTGFGTKVGEGAGAQITDMRQLAKDAQNSLFMNQQAREILSQPIITGAGANFATAFGAALKQVGIDFGGDPVSNTQAFIAQRAGAVGNKIKLFGSGTGLSDNDRDYAAQMAGGKITLTKEAILKILAMDDQSSNRTISMFNNELTKMPKQAAPYDLSIQAPVSRVKYDAQGNRL